MPSDSRADMNLDRLQRTLLDAARHATPSDRVPYAFERRVMARLSAARVDPLAVWSSWLWRSAMSACALAVLAGAVNFSQADLPADDTEPALELASTYLEDALLAPAAVSPEAR